MTLSFLGLLSRSNLACTGLADIKLQIVKYLIFILLQPKFDATRNSLIANRMLNFVNCLTSHISKILKPLNSSKSMRLIALDLNKYDDKNINTVKVLKLLGLSLIFSQYLDLISRLYLIKTIVYTGLEWYLYTNMQVRHLCKILYLAKKNSSHFFLCYITHFNRITNYSGSYLFSLSVNLKSVKCNVYHYLNRAIYLGNTECIFANNCNYLYKPSRQSIACLVDKIKQKLYHKNKQGYWRASNYICSSQALLVLEKILQSWLRYYSEILNSMQILKINRLADYIFYKWQVK